MIDNVIDRNRYIMATAMVTSTTLPIVRPVINLMLSSGAAVVGVLVVLIPDIEGLSVVKDASVVAVPDVVEQLGNGIELMGHIASLVKSTTLYLPARDAGEPH